MTDFKVGTVSHYYDKIEVAVVDLIDNLSLGDKIRIRNNDEEFEQEVESMQMEHKQIKLAEKGETIGLKVDRPVKAGYTIYKK